ncbi:MAG: twin arginine-targeting protein translocase TatB [Methylophilaceae bacterium 17-44-8]|nr:MAG: twin arginine-targeting protein translocase TatB [Methylophilales bacterium 28-44-11]OZA06213.1 MAG: twin arginine-targeting protein translocase TatB [Methylophilaceae bacterium 17-44-8]
MFDISFSELMVVAVVALLVIGPEKLPKLARTLGAYAGRMQRFVAQVKDEVNREVRFEELQKLQQEVKSASLQVESSIMASMNTIEHATNNVMTESDVKPVRSRKRVSAPEATETTSTPADVKPTSTSASTTAKRTATTKKAVVKSSEQKKPARVSKNIAD